MPTDQISSPACLRASTTSLPSMPFACFLKRSQSLSRKGETASRRILDFLFCLFATTRNPLVQTALCCGFTWACQDQALLDQERSRDRSGGPAPRLKSAGSAPPWRIHPKPRIAELCLGNCG